MKRTEIFAFSRLTWLAMILTIGLPFVPQTARAADCPLENSSNYTVSIEGTNQLRIKFPAYDKVNYDCWIVEGDISIKIVGSGTSEKVYHCEMEKDIKDSDYYPNITHKKGVDGNMILYRDRNYGSVSVGTSERTDALPCMSNSETAYVNLLWTIPRKYRGQKVEISWSMHHNGNMTESNKYITITSSTFDISPAPVAQEPVLMDPVISYNASSPNQILVPYMIAATNLKSMTAYYTEVNGSSTTSKTIDLKKEASGFIPFRAEQPIRDLYLKATYTNNENEDETTTSTKHDIPVLHQPKSLNAYLQPDGKVVLNWTIGNTNWAEITPNDSWEVQRNATGNSDPSDPGWTSLGQLSYDNVASDYTFTDDGFLQAYQQKTVFYRVRRTITSIWGWTSQSGYAQTKLPTQLSLPTVTEATVHRVGTWSETSHPVELQFSLGAAEKDKNSNLILRTADDWKAFAKQVNDGNTKLNAIMGADIDLGTEALTMVGTKDRPYEGNFDGNGHTLTFNPEDWFLEECYAPFRYVKDANISHLHVKGSLKSTKEKVAGLIGHVVGNSSATISSCRSSVSIVVISGGQQFKGYHGGFVSYAEGGLGMTNCLFDGKLDCPSSQCTACMVGYSNSVTMMVGCLSAPSYFTNYYNVEGLVIESGNGWTVCSQCYMTDPNLSSSYGEVVRDKSGEELALLLGEGWEYQGGSIPVPVMSQSSDAVYNSWLWDPNAKMVLTTIKGASNDNTVDTNGYFIISDLNDWNTFADMVISTNGRRDLNAILATDLTVSRPLGSAEHPYRGTFEGGGHTLTLQLKEEETDYYALFPYIRNNATIRNLNIKGSVDGGNLSAGLVGYTDLDLTLNIANCRVSATITVHGTGSVLTGNYGNVAGFVGHSLSTVNIRNCLFDGKLATTSDRLSATAFIGEGTQGKNSLRNCLLNNKPKISWYTYRNEDFGPNNTTNWALYNQDFGSYVRCAESEGLNAQQLAAALGSANWTVNNEGVVVPYQNGYNGSQTYIEHRELTTEEIENRKIQLEITSPCLNHNFYLSVEQGNSTLPVMDTSVIPVVKTDEGNLKTYQFDNINAKFTTLKADTLQTGVSLTWETDGGDVDYYRIFRYDKQHPEKVTTLQTQYAQDTYIDYDVQPQHVYVYTIEGVTWCEGEHLVSISKEGCCAPTGMVRGYVRLANGIGMPGITVTATPKNKDQGNVGTCVTDDTGYYEISGLQYQGQGTYDLVAEGMGATMSVTFDGTSNLQTDINFYEQTYYNFAGYVLYEGTSIPVSGVRFLRDGQPVVDASGKEVTTNNQGAFLVNIPAGTHTLQVVKDGHMFKDDGYYIDLDKQSADHNWQKDISDIYLWDQTKVTLRGRVVGGNVEGLKPLGESLSKNNLCDSVRIVIQLEGDNTSWLVRDQLDATVTSRIYDVMHGKEDQDTTHVEAYRHRIVIHPDPETGEYQLPLCPVKYKVTEIYGKNYPTLFQSGTFSETLDLSRYAEGDIATYSRIYHAQPTLDIWQFQGSTEHYYGLKEYTSRDNAGVSDKITLWKDGEYAMGYPVFMAGSSVPMVLSAREEYYYNNEKPGKVDIVQLDGGRVTVGNGLVSVDETDEVELDEKGQGTYVFTPQNTTFMLEDDMALRTLKFTLEYDGSFYDIQPIRAYVMAAMPKSQGRHIIAGQNVHLIDVLRDPPGAGSSAYIEKGSKVSYSYKADYSVQMGVKIEGSMGSGADYYTGFWAGVGSGTEAGTTFSSDNYATLAYDLATKYYQDWNYEYEFETKEKISTSSNAKDVGMNSDVYIGMMDNVVVEDGIAVRMVNSAAMKRLRPGMGGSIEVDGHAFNVTGTAKVLARGWDAVKKDSVYLVRDEVMYVSSKINSTFAHSQTYLLNELIPTLVRTRNALLMDSTTTKDYAQAMANKQKTPVYVSKISTENENFSLAGYYDRYLPQGVTDSWNDTIQALNTQIQTWTGMIAANEKEKLEALDLVKVYDFDGRSDVEYSESFTTTEGLHRYWQLPTTVNLTGSDGFSKGSNNGSGVTKEGEKDGKFTSVNFKAGGVKFGLKITPLFGFDFNYENGKSTEYTKETGFTLSCSRQSSLTVGVYKTHDTLSEDDIKKLAELGDMNVYYKHVEDNLKMIYNGRPGSSNTTSYIETLNSVPRYRNFVFRTLAGATASPWEEERRTIFYSPGAILDQSTRQINKLRIWAKEPSVSNVPYGEPARFTIYFTNESDMPERITPAMNLYAEDGMNPKGAKILIDGSPLTGAGRDVWMEAGVIYEKQVEVYAGTEYDYEDLGISLMDNEDVAHISTLNLSAHFVPAAGPVNISAPGDKWVVNTESAFDGDKGLYYLPVHIDGFDVNFRNFDHIELQYKLSTQGDKDWVNVCSYYPNTEEGQKLMALASGEKELMKNEGFIDVNFYGETDPVEQHYDLRAVCYCRHGGGYLTRASNVVSGIKDTRRPQAFGTPQPTNGILGLGDDIKVAFSEQIAYNHLSPINNFEVLGLTNQSSISLATALQFNGEGSAMSLSNRNLAGKDFTLDLMLKPRLNGEGMNVMTHTMNETAYMSLGVTADRHLTANVNGLEMQSDKAVNFEDMRHVAYVFDVDEEENVTNVTFYEDNTVIGQSSFEGFYGGTGILVFGNNFEGEMLEVRLWNKALSATELAKYGGKRLMGTELGLLDDYPMNEGSGNYAYDKAVGGNDLSLVGTTWRVPDGISLKLDGTEGVKLDSQPFNRQDYEDYSLMLWFRTSDKDATLMSNGEAKEEVGYKDHFNIGFEDGALFFRSGGQQVNANGHYNDGAWHHMAVTVNRSRNVGNLYVDQKLEQSFPVDTLGGIAGNALYLGATYSADSSDVSNVLTGNIDEVAMFEMALPENVLKLIANQTPTGKEMGLLAYLPFSQVEKQMDNSQRMMPSGVSIKRYKDNHGEVVEAHRDTLLTQDIADRLADRNSYAPMANSGMLENIKYNYVADGKDLHISLDVPDYQIEKTNVYVTVREVADLQGNLMASPITMDLYVYQNPLRWNVKRKAVDVKYGEETTVELTIQNLSGKAKDYTLEGLPQWITPSTTSGKVAALDEQPVTLTISPYINIGDFEEVVYIIGENGITEPLPLSIRVRGEEPNWAVNDNLKAGNITMHVVARVMNGEEIAHDTDDILTAVGSGHRTLGTAHVRQGSTENDGLIYLTIYNEAGANGTPIGFEFYDASTGRIYVVEKQNTEIADISFHPDTVLFQADSILGSATAPLLLYTRLKEVQSIRLEKGWNWASSYVLPDEATVSTLLNSVGVWEVGESVELMEDDNRAHLITYKAVYDPNTYSERYYWDNGERTIQLVPQRMYRFYVKSAKNIYIAGENISYEGVNLHKGWNRIGYLAPLNLPLATALSDYTDAGSDGDIIKSQSEFSVLNIDAQGNRTWRGTLEYLRTGEGYMLKRNADTDYTFYYPYYSGVSRYNNVRARMSEAPLHRNTSGASMNVIARVEGVELEEGDRLVAYDRNGNTRGMALADEEGLFFLNVGSAEDDVISFGIENGNEMIATTRQQMTYVPDGVQGSIGEPTVISFVPADEIYGEGWYDLGGRKLSGKPDQRGVYIHNGEKVIVK